MKKTEPPALPLADLLEEALNRYLGSGVIHSFIFLADFEPVETPARELRFVAKQHQPEWVTAQLVNELSEWDVESDGEDADGSD